MKNLEGKILAEDISARLVNLRNSIELIASKAENASNKYREKLIERLEEVLPGSVENEERILREVCLFAERVDVSEEITRFHSHLHQFEEMLQSTEAVGKTLNLSCKN